jgi:hypothetical protein
MDDTTRTDEPDDVEAHGMKETAAAGITAAALAAGGGAASAHAATAPAVHKAPTVHVAATKKSDPTQKVHRQQSAIFKTFHRVRSLPNAMWKYTKS